MRQRALVFDVAVAVLAALLVVVLSPGLAMTGVIALGALILVALSLLVDAVWSRLRPLFRRRRP
jgi:hypothetical protein